MQCCCLVTASVRAAALPDHLTASYNIAYVAKSDIHLANGGALTPVCSVRYLPHLYLYSMLQSLQFIPLPFKCSADQSVDE